jgi:hypothetical protein
MEYSEHRGLYVPPSVIKADNARPNFPPRLSRDVEARGERVVQEDGQQWILDGHIETPTRAKG